MKIYNALLQLEVSEWKEKAALGLGRYKHNQQLEQLRSQQEQLGEDRRSWAIKKQEQDKEFRTKSEALAKLQVPIQIKQFYVYWWLRCTVFKNQQTFGGGMLGSVL